MDEILASIRRIIETGEDRNGVPNGAGSSLARMQRTPYGLGLAPASFQSDSPAPRETVEFIAGRTPLDEGDRAAGAVAAVVAPSDRSDDEDDRLTAALETELAASWGSFEVVPHAAGVAREEPSSLAVDAPATTDDEPVLAVEPAVVGAAAEAEGQEPATADVSGDHGGSFDQGADFRPATAVDDDAPAHENTVSQDQSAMGTESVMSDRSVFEPANTDDRDRRAAARSESAFYAPIHDANAAPLTSDMTGNLVAASFDELAQAIRNGELKSLESMAQEMLRPMLQEWLDDNLPRIVERLVREEIERVARGGR